MSDALVDIISSDIQIKENDIGKCLTLNPLYFEFFHIQEITFEDEAPRREALENVLGSLRLRDVNFIYLIIGKT
ncbi:MAG: hypothetical protein KAH77_11750, partial [Thiomargarita sp.]|nr:hypothetical protein [Thiomargarita sp.]